MCLLAAITGVLRGMDNNILTQIGFVVLIGLAARTRSSSSSLPAGRGNRAPIAKRRRAGARTGCGRS